MCGIETTRSQQSNLVVYFPCVVCRLRVLMVKMRITWILFWFLISASNARVVKNELPSPRLIIISSVSVDSNSIANVLLGSDPGCKDWLAELCNKTTTPVTSLPHLAPNPVRPAATSSFKVDSVTSLPHTLDSDVRLPLF